MHSRGQWGATGELSIDPNSDQHVKKRKKWHQTDELEEEVKGGFPICVENQI